MQDQQLELQKCSLDTNGNVSCKVSKTIFNEIQKLGKNPNRLVLEKEG